jgi:hypothetical protein
MHAKGDWFSNIGTKQLSVSENNDTASWKLNGTVIIQQ